MVLGLLTLELRIDQAHSLKEKRRVLNGLRDTVRGKFNVSIAEVEAQDVWNAAVLGVAVVSNDQRYCNQVLSKVVDWVESLRTCEIEDYATEFLRTD